MSIPVDLPGTPFHRSIKASKYIRKEFLMRIIKQRKIGLAEGKASPVQDILSHMLLTTDEDGKFMKESDIADKILGLLIGGHDTASSACAFIVKYLAELPHVYQGVYKEQMDIAKSKGPCELLNWEDIQKMKLSWNVACEVLRLAPPVQGAFKDVLTDFMYEGFYIPKGWKIYWSTHSTHKIQNIFRNHINSIHRDLMEEDQRLTRLYHLEEGQGCALEKSMLVWKYWYSCTTLSRGSSGRN
ncbi:unnamed protein product [Camellia sinensis]